MVVVTGATGNLGGAVASALAVRGVETRLALRRPDSAAALFPHATRVKLDFDDASTFAPALRGARGLFLIRPPQITRVETTLNALIDQAVAEGLRHVVFVSVAGAETNRRIPHHRVEAHLKRARLDWTLLRPGFFTQNIGEAYRRDIAEEDRIYLPAGDARVAFIDTRDIGEVAAAALLDPDVFAGRACTLVGPQALSFGEVAALLSDVLGRRIRYEPAAVPAYLWHLRRRRGLGLTQAVIQTLLHMRLRRGDTLPPDDTLADLLGRPPTTVAQYLEDHAALWRP